MVAGGKMLAADPLSPLSYALSYTPQTKPDHFLQCVSVHYLAERGHCNHKRLCSEWLHVVRNNR